MKHPNLNTNFAPTTFPEKAYMISHHTNSKGKVPEPAILVSGFFPKIALLLYPQYLNVAWEMKHTHFV